MLTLSLLLGVLVKNCTKVFVGRNQLTDSRVLDIFNESLIESLAVRNFGFGCLRIIRKQSERGRSFE
jgi:hypothetical protein